MVRDVFSNRNILAISLTSSLWTLVQMAWNPFWVKYEIDYLGATGTIVGMLSMISTAENLLFQLPGGILADRYGRKKIIIIGTFLRSFSPLICFLAPSWEWIVPAALVNGAASLYMPAFNAIVADSLPEKRRGAGYGAYNTVSNIPMIFSPIIGGYAIEIYGYQQGVKLFLFIQILVSLIMTVTRWYLLKETVDVKTTKHQSLMPSKNMISEFPQPIKVMIVVAIIGSFSSRLVFDFINLYALDVLHLSPSQYGFITTVCGGIAAILALPGGMLSDKHGRKNNIMIGRLVAPISQGLVTFTWSYESYFAVRAFNSTGIAIGGGGMEAGGPSWNALIADLMPPAKRATVMGTIGTLTAVVAAPSSVIGGWLWDNVSRQLPFQLSMIIGLISAAIFFKGVKEPKENKY